MMGRTHALSGATVFLAVTPMLGLGWREVVAGTLVCTGAALLPDLDHPHSCIARSWGPLTRAISRMVAWLAGGHRKGTHGFLFIALAGLAGWALGQAGGWWAVVPVFLAACLAIGVLWPGKGLRNEALAGVLALAVYAGQVETGWLGYAFALGSAVHIAGDCLTPERCPLLWPYRRRYGIGLFTTDTRPEVWLARLLVVVNLALVITLAGLWPEMETIARTMTGVGA